MNPQEKFIIDQVEKNLIEIAFFSLQSYGLPIVNFKYEVLAKHKNLLDQLIFIENFRKRHPNILTPIKRYEE